MDAVINMNDLSAVEYEMLSYCEKLGGQTSSIELVALYRITQSLPENARILEIGSYRGRSAAAFGFAIKNTSKKLYCLDIWRNYNTQDDNPRKGDLVQDPLELTDLAVFEDFLKKTELFGDSICHLRGKNSDFKDIFAEDSFNMVFIDGAHDYDNVCFDIDTALMILKPGSIICGHDYHSAGIGVKKAVNEKIFDNPEIKSDGIIPETSIWIAILE